MSPSEPVLTYDTVHAAISNQETYTYDTGVGGDEDGVVITQQANHFATSSIVRNDSTNYVAVYIYEPHVGFTGIDSVELEKRTGSDGASPPNRFETVRIIISVQN